MERRRVTQDVATYSAARRVVAAAVDRAAPLREPPAHYSCRASSSLYRRLHGQRPRRRVLWPPLVAQRDRETSAGHSHPGVGTSTMSVEQLFSAWAPPESPWSAWAKPVLFADAPLSASYGEHLELPDIDGFPRARDIAVVIDVEGTRSVLLGLALAKIGYRPVPLYNSGVSPGMIVNMRGIANQLTAGGAFLQRTALRPDAPPAFLLNADRLENSERALTPGSYDNRCCFVPQDMPSASYLLAAGISQVLLVAEKVRDDISHVLCRYQDAGLTLRRKATEGTPAMPLTVKPPPLYKSFLYRLGVFAGLRRNAAGGFGGLVPMPGTRSGFG